MIRRLPEDANHSPYSALDDLASLWIVALSEALSDARDRETAEIIVLGNLLQDACASALEVLQRLGHIRRFIDARPLSLKDLPDPREIDAAGLVKIFRRLNQRTEVKNPDFLVILLDGTEIELECKNWEAKKKKYPNSYGDRWLYFWNDTFTKAGKVILGCKDRFKKNWTSGRKKVLLVSKWDIFGYDAKVELTKLFDAIALVGYQIVQSPTKIDGEHIAITLFDAFSGLR